MMAWRQAYARHPATRAYNPRTNGLAHIPGHETFTSETILQPHSDTISRILQTLYGFERHLVPDRSPKAMGGKTPYQLTQKSYTKQPK